jgi:hypothetical protein
MNKRDRAKGGGRSTTIPVVLLSLLLVLLGLLLLALSGLISDHGVSAYFRAFFKDLGIVILAVTTAWESGSLVVKRPLTLALSPATGERAKGSRRGDSRLGRRAARR